MSGNAPADFWHRHLDQRTPHVRWRSAGSLAIFTDFHCDGGYRPKRDPSRLVFGEAAWPPIAGWALPRNAGASILSRIGCGRRRPDLELSDCSSFKGDDT